MFTAALFTTVKTWNRISRVAQWIRSHLPMQGTQVPSLVQEDSMCCTVPGPLVSVKQGWQAIPVKGRTVNVFGFAKAAT